MHAKANIEASRGIGRLCALKSQTRIDRAQNR